MKSLLEMTEEELDNLSEDEFVENFLKLSEDDQEKVFEKFPELKSLLDDDDLDDDDLDDDDLDDDDEDDIYAEFDAEVDKLIEEELANDPELKELWEEEENADGEPDDESLEDFKNANLDAELSEEELKELGD